MLIHDARRWLIAAGILGAVGVALGAFGAHALPQLPQFVVLPHELPRAVQTWETAVRYHLLHVLALFGLAAVMQLAAMRTPCAQGCRRQALAWRAAAWLWLAGVAIFSGCLYVLVLSGQKWLGAVVPLGGAAMIAGWIALAVGAWNSPASKTAASPEEAKTGGA